MRTDRTDNTNVTFSFGKNWEEFVHRSFGEERVNIAKTHILDFLEMPSLEGKCFLDIGCGSGIHSLAAWQAGADQIVSFDLDPYSVKTTNLLRDQCTEPKNWEVMEGSILDKNFNTSLAPADIVYSWGVLHHTGSMWEAIRNASRLVKTGGLFYIALYTTNPKSDYWLQIKKKYNRRGSLAKNFMISWYVLRQTILPLVLKFQNPFRYISEYKKKRGMSYLTDVKDWLGGYPFEHTSIEKVFHFLTRELDFEMINIKTGRLNTEYLFRKL